MKKRSKPAFNGAEIITALIYLCSICALTMYLLCKDYAVICTIIMTALCSGIYMLFYAFRNRKLISFCIFISLFAAVALICSSVGAAMGRIALIEFIYTTSDTFSVPLAAASIVLFSFVVTYPVFYFTVRLPRPCFLLLPALAPLILGARTVGALPAGLVAFLAAGYFVAIMGVSRLEYPADNVYIEDKHSRKERLIAFGLFGVIAAGVLLIVPRNDRTIYSRYLDTVWFSRPNFYGTRSTGFSQSSSPNTGNNEPPEDLLFYVWSEYPNNIISQSFDKYRGKDGWTYLQKYSYGHSDWRDEQSQLNYNKLAYDLKSGAKDGKLVKYADDLLNLPDISEDSIKSTAMYIQAADNVNSTVVLHPTGTFNASIANRQDTIYRNAKDEMFTETPFGVKASYTLDFYGRGINTEFARYLSGLSGEEYIELLDLAAEEEVISEEAAYAFINAFDLAEDYLIDTTDAAITPKIRELAETITAGLNNDYDKAKAIEEWFGRDGFVYDLNFVPQELTAEYFLFKSKRGICTDFATASTLLLRAAGVSARYTEGYLIKTDIASIDMYGRYEVKADQGHAFASAYIPGGGWIEIDGTKTAAMASAAKEAQRVIFYIVAVVAVVIVLCVIFRKRLSEAIFSIRYKLGRGTKKIRALYLRTRRIACSITGAEPKSATSGEVRDVISRTLLLEKEAGEITDAADALIYGGGDVKLDEKRLYKNYKLILKARRARGKG